MFQRFFDDGLAQSSYVIACERTRQAAVVDPRRDVDVYAEALRAGGFSLVYTIETHIHADFVSGAKELVALGSRPVAGPGADLGFPHHQASHGETLRLGDVELTLLHTPGHTPEHISVLVTAPDAPLRVLTGDTLFVSAVGRPDLLGDEMSRGLAGALFDSLHDVLLRLDDRVEVHPGHGAGSLCGASIGSASSSTIGAERQDNAFLQHRTRAAFVAAVLADLPETPPYFARMKEINRAGPGLLGVAAPGADLPAIDAAAALAAVTDHAVILDLRSADAFAREHPAGALHLEFGPKAGHWAAWVLPATACIILLAANQDQAHEIRRQLWRVGLPAPIGWIDGGLAAWRRSGLPVASIGRTPVRELDHLTHRNVERTEQSFDATSDRDGPRPLGAGDPLDSLTRQAAPLTIVDVRSRREFESGHIDGAVHIGLDEIAARAPELRRAQSVATICETGYRSSLAASLLARAGMTSVTSIAGGMAEYRMRSVPR